MNISWKGTDVFDAAGIPNQILNNLKEGKGFRDDGSVYRDYKLQTKIEKRKRGGRTEKQFAIVILEER